MSITEQEWQKEQQRVDRVTTEIRKRTEQLQEQVGLVKADIVEIRKNFWDDVKVNFENAVEAAETVASMRQQSEVLGERERQHRHAQKELKSLLRLKENPYFGRIDFAEPGEGLQEIYLGTASYFDEESEQFLVFDWRAPVSSLYYDYSPGPATYETPGGTVEGTMELKRQFIIRDAVIKSLFDTGVTIGDELLQQVLGRHSDAQMKSIVATIQKEQNRIIRNERNRLLVVQGAAGSGKTSAALQRVAYLLYRYREWLSADQIVLFSPNDMFNSYIATVLPELGEENMQQTTFQEYLERRLGRQFELEDPFLQMEYVLTAMEEPGYAARVEGIQYKASVGFMRLLERYAKQLGDSGMVFKNLKFRGEQVISAEQIAAKYAEYDTAMSIPNRMRLLTEWLLLELETAAEAEIEKDWVQEEIDLLDNEEYLKAYQHLRRQKRFRENTFDDFDRERKVLGEMVVRKKFKPLRTGVKRLKHLDVTAMYRQLFADPELAGRLGAELPPEFAEFARQTVEKMREGELYYEDATPYLYLKELLEGVEMNTQVRHVFVDEAQDYSPFQFAFLKRLFPHARMTVLGDLNQAIYAHAQKADGFGPLADLYPEEERELIVLRQSYRSTRQIVDFTRKMMPGGEEIQPFNREGEEPTVTRAADADDLTAKVLDRLHELQAEGHRTVAVICKTAEESRAAYERLQGRVEVKLIGKETVHFEPGLVVIPAYLAKGVEFDAVILYDASQERYGRESERRLFYTACTRAMHELHLFYIGEPSLFLA
ncbi:DNA helicase-2/ATP-dependent DNA helicase PcrA [Tumebacillus sp. BK434]|uniref:RNA polymerase recycling motor HelD n=1 Tax=Tumebacillus sp. BK434 TaxID=2512169 RepID=UPI001050A518|nr:RNA polymerase recycling motor HelD [Tumebacillus sp. BK434]TCP57966.1 DNA helicase-2/ATP-dependent DNA helicase PcrA [Tumebacillus sp. BK434]